LVASLASHPGFLVLKKRFEEARTRHFMVFANNLMNQRGLVDQREVDEKRGYWEAGRAFFREVEKGNMKFLKSIEGVESK
jgi:hypothetical protein